MAAIVTDEDFRLAAGTWADQNPGVFQGTRSIDATARKIYDERPGGIVDVTPSSAALEAALDDALEAIADEEELAEALAALEEGRQYLKAQLDTDNPVSLTVLVGNIKPVVDGNTYLTQWMTRYLNVWSTATTLPVSMNPNTDPLRARYILALADVISIRKPVA